VDLSDADVERLRVSDAGDVRVYTVVTIADDLVTVNLMGPIVVNGGNQLAKQIVLNDARYTTRHTIARLPVCA
jgi:flagellar assembly factor FliW